MIECQHNWNEIKNNERRNYKLYNVKCNRMYSTTINMVLYKKGGICYEEKTIYFISG